jgi:NAD(P)-dependent dehydrogenase (short-subunit alcohol dehydrogenase family)
VKLTGTHSAPQEQSGAHRTALVTGGTGGIGFHIAAGLARTGMHLLVTGRNPATLTTHLLPQLAKPRTARIVNVVSSAFEMWKHDPFEDVNAEQHYVGIEAYAHGKLVNVLASQALSRHLADTDIAVNLVNPGMAWTAGVAGLTPDAVPQWRFVWPIVRWFQRRASAEDAARGPIFVATAGEEVGSGLYFEGVKERALPPHVMNTTTPDRARTLAELLIAKTLPASSRTGVL